MAQKRSRSPSPTDGGAAQNEDPYFKSAPVEDRQSTFISIFSPTLSGRDLQKHTDFKRADHKIVATRKVSSQQTIAGTGKRIYNAWSDDDGEKYAGKHLERVLAELDVEGAVVVARWYGGVLLGPVRFEHIKTVARDAIRNWKESQREAEASVKKLKIENDDAERVRLAKQLKERDESIIVLRKLLADKKKPATGREREGPGKVGDQKAVSPMKQTGYENMSLAQLKQLDKARDATIGFVLKQIDAVEANQEEAALLKFAA